MGLMISTAPTCEPVTVEEAAEWLRLTNTADYPLVNGLIVAARQHVETIMRRCLIATEWKYTLDDFPCGDFDSVIKLPRPPLQSVSSIKYHDSDGTEQTWSSAEYLVDTTSEPGVISRVYGFAWPYLTPRRAGITITYVAGYTPITVGLTAVSDSAKRAAVPEAIKVAIRMLVCHWFENPLPVNVGNIATPFDFAMQSILSGQSYGSYTE